MLTAEQIKTIGDTIDLPQAPVASRTNRFKAAFGVIDPVKSYKFGVQMPEIPKEEKVRRAEEGAASSRVEADKANSVGGFTKNFASSLLGNLAPAEVGLGETISKIAGPGPEVEMKAITELSDTRSKVLQAIKEGKKAGQDTSRLEIQFNRTSDLIDQYMGQITEKGQLPSAMKVVGQLGGTTLDILSSGTYGAARGTLAGMTSFRLAPKIGALPTTLQALRNVAAKPAGLFTLKGLTRVGEGALIGYGYDITSKLREVSEDVLSPGIGTAIGAGLPGLGALTTSARKVAEPLITRGKIMFGKVDDSMRATATNELETAWAGFFDNKKSTRKKIATEIAQGKDPAKELAEGGYIPKVINDKLNTEDIVAKQTEQIAERMDAIDTYVAQFPDKNIKLDDIRASARQSLIEDPQVGPDLKKSLSELDSFFDSYKLKYGDDIDLATVNQIRKDMNAKTKSYKTDTYAIDTADSVGKAARETIDNVTNNEIVRNVNAEIGRIGSARKMAALIDGDVVKYGKVSRWAARLLGATIGSSISSPLGIGPLIGSLGGDAIVSVLQQLAFSNPNRTRILQTITKDETLLQKIANETSEAAKAYLNKQLEQLRLPRLPAPTAETILGGSKNPRIPVAPTTFEPAAQQIRRELPMNEPKTPLLPASNPIQVGGEIQPLRESSTINQNATNAIIPSNPIDNIISQEAQKYNTAEEFVKAKTGALLEISKTVDDTLGKNIDFKIGNANVRTSIRETPKEIYLNIIGTRKADNSLEELVGSGKGTDVINVLKEYADLTGKKFIIPDVTNKALSFWKKFSWLEEDYGIKVPLDGKQYNPPNTFSYTPKPADSSNSINQSKKQGQTNPATLLGGAALSGATLAANASNKDVIKNPAADSTPIVAGKAIKSLLDSIAFVETNTVKGDKYKFHKPSGNKELGDDLGKYQVTEGELSDYSKLLLGRTITKDEFLNSADVQDEYMNAKIRFLLEEGLTTEEIIAMHAQGMTGWGNKETRARKIKEANENRSSYVINAMNVYNKNK